MVCQQIVCRYTAKNLTAVLLFINTMFYYIYSIAIIISTITIIIISTIKIIIIITLMKLDWFKCQNSFIAHLPIIVEIQLEDVLQQKEHQGCHLHHLHHSHCHFCHIHH